MIKRWKENAFWDNEEQTRAKAILEVEDENGSITTQVLTVNQYDELGEPNPDWTSLIEQLGTEAITVETEARKKRKEEESRLKKIREEEVEKAKLLEKLFNAKLEAFEIEEIKASKNRALKTKLRRAKNMIEVNIYAMMIIMEQLENGSSEE